MADETSGSESSQPHAADGGHPPKPAGTPAEDGGGEVTLDQSEIESLLNQAETAAGGTTPAADRSAAPSPTAVVSDRAPAATGAESPSIPQRDIEFLLQ